MTPKRVLIFSLAYYPRVGGAEVAIQEITKRTAGIDFEMITRRFSTRDAVQEKIGNILVHRVAGPAWLFPLTAAFKARALHRQKKFDAAWAMMSYMLLPAVIARLGIPYALTLQEGDTYEHMFGRWRIAPFLPLIDTGFRRAAVVQAISTYLGEWAALRGYEGKVEVIPNGVDLQQFSGEPVAHDGVVLITSSRLVHKNGVDTIIHALSRIPDAQLVVCGVGQDEAKLKSLARELGVERRVHWRGFVPHSELPRHLHHADIFIRPSRSEGMGNSFVEAFAAGIPVIATQVGGLKDFITPEVAWPVRPESPEDIAEAVAAIRGNAELRGQVVHNARELARAKYDWDIVARSMKERVFSALLHA